MVVYDGHNKLKGRIALVGCCGRKVHAQDIPAETLFIGTAYLAAREYANSKFDGWFLLSGKYGLLRPDELVSHYDMFLGAQDIQYRREWAQCVASSIREAVEPGSSLTFLCGKHYWEGVVPIIEADFSIELPLRHLRQGEQVKWLREQVEVPLNNGQSDPRMPRERTIRSSSEVKQSMTAPNTEDFRKALREKFKDAEARGLSSIEIISGELHREVGGYPGTHHRMPVCCDAMYGAMSPDDKVVYSPPKGKGATLKIRYKLPRPR